MKLVTKLSLAFIAGTTVILTANGWMRVQREVALFESERTHADALIGTTLASAAADVWRAGGDAAALDLVERANQRDPTRIRWMWLDAPEASTASVPRAALEGLAPGASLVVADAPDGGGGPGSYRHAFVRVAIPEPRGAVIEVTEPRDAERAYIRRTIIDTVVTGLTLDAFCAALAMVLGAWLVGGPARKLIEKARRVGAGDFSEPLDLDRKDELAELAAEMNTMCEQLVGAHARAARATQARIAMLEQLRHADRLMTVGKLASGIAHEIGTPLNVVEVRATMLADGDVSPADAADYGRVIVRATGQITRIIRQLLDFARPRRPQKERVPVLEIARHTVELLRPLAAKRHVQVEAKGDPAAESDVDSGQIEQAVTNLLMNAIQAARDGGRVEVTVDNASVDAPPEQGPGRRTCVRVAVSDEGPGIAEEHLAHVFEPFFTTKDVGEGTGLGLSVTYGIVREHGGWISVESAVARGSTFTIHLPA